MKLYELSAQMSAFLADLEAGNIPEEAIADTLEGLEGALADKLDDCAAAYKALIYEADCIKAECDKLDARIKTKKNEADRLKAYMDTCLKQTAPFGKKPNKMETPRSVLSYRTVNVLSVDDPEKVLSYCSNITEYADVIRVKPPEIDKTALKAHLKEGAPIPGTSTRVDFSLQIK